MKTYGTGYFSKQQNETGYFCGMTLTSFILLFSEVTGAVSFERRNVGKKLKMLGITS